MQFVFATWQSSERIKVISEFATVSNLRTNLFLLTLRKYSVPFSLKSSAEFLSDSLYIAMTASPRVGYSLACIIYPLYIFRLVSKT
jgi:hypothetical protein